MKIDRYNRSDGIGTDQSWYIKIIEINVITMEFGRVSYFSKYILAWVKSKHDNFLVLCDSLFTKIITDVKKNNNKITVFPLIELTETLQDYYTTFPAFTHLTYYA